MDKEKFCQWLREQISASHKMMARYEVRQDEKLVTLSAEQFFKHQAFALVLAQIEAGTFDQKN